MVRAGVLAFVVFLIAGAVPAFSSSGSHGTFVLTRVHMKPGTAAPRAKAASHRPLVARPALYRREKAAANAGYKRWLKLHPAKTTAHSGRFTSVSGGLSHLGLAASDAPNAVNGGPFTPPDTTGAIGPSNYVEMVNSEIGVYDKNNLSTAPTTMDQPSFVGDPSVATCDGQIQWDQQAQRWLYAAIECDSGPFKLYFGWSKTSSPDLTASNWCQYKANTGSRLEDYPKLGHDGSQILIGANEFDYSTGNFNSVAFVFDKPTNNADTSCPAALTETSNAAELTLGSWPATANQPSGAFTPVPANLADNSTNGYVVATDWDSSHIDVFTIGRDGGSHNVLLNTTSVSVPAFCVPPIVPQQGTTDTLDSLDGRLTQAVATTDPDTTHEGIWTQQTVAQSCSNGTPSGPSVVRWYELTPGDTTPTQIGTVHGPNGSFAFLGAISPSSDGQNAAIFYNSSSSSSLPDVRVQDRHRYTTHGTMIEDLQVAQSAYADEDYSCDPVAADGFPCRWGDYAAASPDPSNPALVWGTEELTPLAPSIFSDPQWGSENAAIDVTPAANYTLNVATADIRTATGSVTSGDTIINCPGACSHSYAYNTPVVLTANPGPHDIVTWSGDCTGTGTECDLPMGGPQSVTATFSPVQDALGYTKSGNGNGSVTSSPTGLSCGSSCSRSFDYGTAVELTATPSTGSSFAGWSGDCNVVNGKCDVTMDQARTVAATFTLIPETLSVSDSGAGSGTVTSDMGGISCGFVCAHSYDYGTSVTLTPTPATGSVFTGWTGACSGTGGCTVSMNAAESVTATFGLIPEALTVSKSGTGSGTVASTIAGISCGATCSSNFDYGTTVTLTATPDAHVTFDGWSGACSGTGNCVVSMAAATSVTATFTAILCEVPNVKGKGLSAAKGAIQDANCSVGAVTKKFSKKVKKGKVISQSPASGSEKPFGAAVKLVVSKGKP
jgi:hypothetical protein